MATSRVWAIKGVSGETRDAARDMAHEAGLTIGEWVDRPLAKAAAEARHPRPPATRPEPEPEGDVAGVAAAPGTLRGFPAS
jgi:hypothetical protein